MIEAIEEHREDVRRLCEKFGVGRLDVFGSAVACPSGEPEKSLNL